jgi:SAM-dependent methyltransferase
MLSHPGAAGQVLGLDVNPVHVALAREFVAERGLANATVVEGDARHTGLPAGSFDVVHARLVLVTIPDPAEVVAEMVRLATPGGWVGGEEADGLFLCQPSFPAWDRLTEAFLAVWAQDGADIHLGRRLPEMLRAAGLVDVGVTVRADAYPVGSSGWPGGVRSTARRRASIAASRAAALSVLTDRVCKTRPRADSRYGRSGSPASVRDTASRNASTAGSRKNGCPVRW